ncbi:MAG: carboxypeptidase-like regulatory domain-containing protein, partial [Edaphobacter sp.]
MWMQTPYQNVPEKLEDENFEATTMLKKMNDKLSSPIKKRSLLAGFVAIFVLLLSTSFPAPAQQTTATVVGNVTDTSGAVVEGAAITVTNTATNTKRSTVTDGSGQYSVPALPAGHYSLGMEKTGFQAQHVDSIILEASQTARQDFKISPGAVTETVTV